MKLLDSLRSLVTGLGGAKDKTTALSYAMTLISDVELNAMHRTDWLARKIVDIIPNDMTREWRDWQAEGNHIELIEGLEKAPLINTQAKVNEAMRKARLLRGSAIYMGMKNAKPEELLELDKVKKGDLLYLNVVNRSEISLGDIIQDVTSEFYGEPEFYELQVQNGGILRIHPSRMIRFIGAEILDKQMDTDHWGDSILQIVYSAIQNATSVQQHIAALIPEAKTDVIYIPRLSEFLRDPRSTEQLTSRFTYANTIKSMFNMVLLEGEGDGKTGEKWEQKQIGFSQLPEILQQFLQIASGAADIPVTRLLGQSPAGMNSTGESDIRNYYDNLSARQRTQLSPQLHRLDEVTIRSALGVRPPEIYYTWAPLWALSELEKANVFNTKITGIRAIAGGPTPLIPIEALSDSLVNMLVEDGTLPGLENAIEEFGRLADQEESSEEIMAALNIKQKEKEVKQPLPPVKKAANDAEPRPLYVRRDVLNKSAITAWAKGQGMTDIEDDLHVTIIYSRAPFDWIKAGNAYYGGKDGKLEIPAGGPRVVEPLGKMAAVLMFASSELSWRHTDIVNAGASHDYDSYQPHISLTKTAIDLAQVEPYRGAIILGPEIFEELDTSYGDANPYHEPAGTEKGGQFARKEGFVPLNSTVVEGKRLIEGDVPDHIAALRIPPAWTDVVYNPDPEGNLLVTGRDAKGRLQSIYSETHASTQAAAKFARIQELDAKYDSIFSQNEKARTNPATKDAADCARLVMVTGIRPGSDKDTGSEHQAYGATTLEGRHVLVEGGKTYLNFVAGKKGGATVKLPVTDAATAALLRERKAEAGASGRLFGGLTDEGLRDHVNSFNGGSFTTKDFRTLLGTRTALRQVAALPKPTSMTAYKKAVKEVATKVSDMLGNTPTVALQSYINPVVFAGWRLNERTIIDGRELSEIAALRSTVEEIRSTLQMSRNDKQLMRDAVAEAIRDAPTPTINITVPITMPKRGKEIMTVEHDDKGRIVRSIKQEED